MKTQKTVVLLTAAAVSVAALSTASFAKGPHGFMFPFETVDANKDGKVTEAELDTYRATASVAMDANADGKLTVEELTAAHLARLTEVATVMATEMVERLDTDGDKALSAAEMATRPMPAMLFERADADKDGAVTKAEVDAMQDKMKQRMAERAGKPGHWRMWDMLGGN